MRAKFYRMHNGSYEDILHLVTLHIDGAMPAVGQSVKYNGQLFAVDRVVFDLEECEYTVYVAKA